ncbi:MAG: uracil-DNA glycosylase [Planctomycetes bacterium]|nr:uracil-DNA glycosylase [Planctomycetota bacterium]
MDDRLRILAFQNAETSRLMGVEYVPMYRTDAPDGPALTAPPQLVQPTPAQVAAPMPRVAAMAEVKLPQRVATVQPTLLATPKSPFATPTCPAEVAAARTPEQAQAALDALRARYEADAPHKHFKTDHHSIVWGEGEPRARLMFIGEAPGEEEDKTGRPFVGKAGQLLNKMIAGMGLKREQVYIANVLKTRPPGNATPTTQEAEACAPYLFEQIAIVGPEAIVTLGLPATRLLLATIANMGELRGRWSQFRCADGRKIPVMPTYHPAYLLRSYTDENRAKVWSDLKMVIVKLGLSAAAT